MLVKFKNDSKDFEDKVEVLKNTLGVGAASKVAEYCVDNFTRVDKELHRALDMIEYLMGHIDDIKRAEKSRIEAEVSLKSLLAFRIEKS